MSTNGTAVASQQKIRGHNLSKKVYAYSLEGKLYNIFDSLAQAGKDFNVNPATIRKYAQHPSDDLSKKKLPQNDIILSFEPIQFD